MLFDLTRWIISLDAGTFFDIPPPLRRLWCIHYPIIRLTRRRVSARRLLAPVVLQCFVLALSEERAETLGPQTEAPALKKLILDGLVSAPLLRQSYRALGGVL